MTTESVLLRAGRTGTTYRYQEKLCSSLSETEVNETIALAVLLGAPAPYILPRLKEYDVLVAYYQNEKLVAFQLLQQFSMGDDYYVYHGPAFSRAGAFLPMFVRYINELSIKHSAKNIFLLAEIQNLKMLMVLHGLFAQYGYSFLSQSIPADIQQAVPLFCRRYAHMGTFNPANFTTSSGYSLCREAKDCSSLSALLAAYNIRLSGGDNMLFAAKLPAAMDERCTILEQVKQGAEKVSCWGEYKKAFLDGLRNRGR